MSIIMRRDVYENLRIGCCGAARHDIITPHGDVIFFEEFKEEALKVVESYGKPSYDNEGDCWLLEFYEENDDSALICSIGDQYYERNVNPAIYKIERNDDGSWSYYKHGELVFTADSYEGLIEKWTNI